MTQDHDALFFHTFSQPEHAASLLRGLLPPAVADEIDWRTLRLLPGTSVDEALQARHADPLYSATMRGQAVLLYVVLEHKSGDDPLTAFQVLRYVVRAYDRYLVENPGARTLPPVVPIVVHHGPEPWRSARSMRDLVALTGLPEAVRRALAPLQPDLRFLLDDLAAVPEEELEARTGTLLHRATNLLLQFVRPATERDPVAFVERWRDLFVALWQHPEGRASLYAVFPYLAAQLEAPVERFAAAGALIHDDVSTMGQTIADQFRAEGYAKGVARGREEGREEGRFELLLDLCRARFGEIPEAVVARLRCGGPDEQQRWLWRLLTATRMDDLFA